MSHSRNVVFGICLNFLGSMAFATDISISGVTHVPIQLNQEAIQSKSLSQESFASTKSVELLEFTLSDQARQIFFDRVNQLLQDEREQKPVVETDELPQKIQLGMNDVPTLDQGQHGSCVTFAVTAALDAALNKGNYISQLCLLQLGNYFEKYNHEYSGWNGLWADIAYDRISKYGIMSRKAQREYGCGGYKKYPAYGSRPKTDISPGEYVAHGEKITDQLTWKTLFSREDIRDKKDEMNDVLKSVKAALKAGHRVTFAVLLPRTDLGNAGADAWHHYFSDSWVLSYDIARALKSGYRFPGHEMVITGYDDKAVAMDSWGYRHHGLFTIRNSWGGNIADWGDFYMSYDYFKALAVDAQEVQLIEE